MHKEEIYGDIQRTEIHKYYDSTSPLGHFIIAYYVGVTFLLKHKIYVCFYDICIIQYVQYMIYVWIYVICMLYVICIIQ